MSKEDVYGVSEDTSSLTVASKARFQKNAIQDPKTGELYLGPDQFIDAVAPADQDYVRIHAPPPSRAPVQATQLDRLSKKRRKKETPRHLATGANSVTNLLAYSTR